MDDLKRILKSLPFFEGFSDEHLSLLVGCARNERAASGTFLFREGQDATTFYLIREGIGMGCTEAPRGILYHRYKVDGHGLVQQAKIVPPTAQNLRTMESDLRAFATQHRHLPIDRLTWQCEQAVRNYDPCISCATHFLRLEVESP